MSKKLNPELIDEENPEWTAKQIARSRPASEGLPKIFGAQVAQEMLKPRSCPRAMHLKERINICLSHDLVTHFKSSGDGWQTRINAALKDWVRTHLVV